MTNKAKTFLRTISVVAGLMLPLSNASAQSVDLEELSAQWWQWALSIPTPVNPTLDSTGGNCVVGQRGSTWFLSGAFFGGTSTRRCSVPEGTNLFFPVANSINFNTPNVCGQGQGNISVRDLRSTSASFVDGVDNMEVDLDGKQANGLVRVRSDVFAVALPEDNVFDAPCTGANLGNVPAGIYSPAVDDGFYVMLMPLKAGNHTLRIRAQNSSQGFTLDLTYNLTVVRVSSKNY